MKPMQALRNAALVLCLLPVAAHAADDPKSKSASPAPKNPPVVVSPSGNGKPQLGVAKPPCVYKPVMTASDMEACGIGKR